MDVGRGDIGAVPVSPISFKTKIPDSIQVIPVVFIVNDILKNQTTYQLNDLAGNIIHYVNGRIKSSGKSMYNELKIDCEWTRTTRDNYFYLLNCIRQNAALTGKSLYATLRPMQATMKFVLK